MYFSESEEFAKELKKLKKKYRTLEDDIAILNKTIVIAPARMGKHDVILRSDEKIALYAVKKRMMCRAVRGSQFRVTYLYKEDQAEILCTELFYKGNKEREDSTRINQYFEEALARYQDEQ